MSIAETVSGAFEGVLADRLVSDEQIRETQDPMELLDPQSLLRVVPRYMQYCIEYPYDDSLVALRTVNALAEYGRSKDPSDSYLNFKFLCDDDQRRAVVAFLIWAKGPPHYEDEEQIERAIKHWRQAIVE